MLLNNKLIYCLLYSKRFTIEIVLSYEAKFFCFKIQNTTMFHLRLSGCTQVVYIYSNHFLDKPILCKKLNKLETNARNQHNKLSC